MERKYAYAVERGTWHSLNRLPCQDCVDGKNGNEGICVAIADGAGSNSESHFAAQIAVDTVVRELSNGFSKWFEKDESEIAEQMLMMCNEEIMKMHPDINADTTLLLVAISPSGEMIIGHLGDGVIIAQKYNGEKTIISEPENGDNPNETFFISHVDAKKHLRIQKMQASEVKGMILCSDGIEKALWNKQTDKYATAIDRIIEWVEKYPSEVVSERLRKELDEVFRVNTQDDMSLAVIV